MNTICFTAQDLALFGAESRDRNPLHLSDAYARTTPYGEPVVFGILGALAALGHLPDREGMGLSGMSCEFRNPMAVGVNYRIDVSESTPQKCLAKIYDCERLMMKATFTFVPQRSCPRELEDSDRSYPTEAADRKPEDLQLASRMGGMYSPSMKDLDKVIARWGLSSKGATAAHLAAMMWTSFIVGMEVPGKRAIFWKVMLDFQDVEGQSKGPLSYSVTIKDFDARVDLLHTTGDLSCGRHLWATAQIWAFVRRDSPKSSVEQIAALLPESDRLKGKVALVIGGSRGLGAAISQALAQQGCAVLVNYRHCTAEAEQMRSSLGEHSDRMELVQGDAADWQWCQELRRHIVGKHKGLDFLVCNASPPIRPLLFGPEKLEQFQEFLVTSLAVVSTPMSSFLSALSERSGWNVVVSSAVVSSAFVRDLPADWPHYVTAKCAIEGLAQWAAVHYQPAQTLIVRPPKLLTDQTNTTAGRQGAMGVEQAATAIVRHLCSAIPSKTVQVLEAF